MVPDTGYNVRVAFLRFFVLFFVLFSYFCSSPVLSCVFFAGEPTTLCLKRDEVTLNIHYQV